MSGWLKKGLALLLCLCALATAACAEEGSPLDSFTLKHGSRESKKVAITVDEIGRASCRERVFSWV